MNPMSKNPGTIFFVQISEMIYFTHMFDVIYDLNGLIRNRFYVYKALAFGVCILTHQSPSEKRSILKGKNLLPVGANSLLSE